MSRYEKKYKQYTHGVPTYPSLLEALQEYEFKKLDEMKGEMAFKFYGWLFEPEAMNENQSYTWKKKGTSGENNKVLVWPYLNRIVYSARLYEGLNISSRKIILEARRQGIFWRGDDIKTFINLIEATKEFRNLSPEKKEASKKGILKNSKKLLNNIKIIFI